MTTRQTCNYVEKFSAVISVKFDNRASCSLIDLGSLQTLGLDAKIAPSDHHLIDASGRDMNIMGSIVVWITFGGFLFQQNLKVLNAQTCKHVLLGRDFLSTFDTIQFDMARNKIKLGTEWFVCVSSKGREPVRVQSSVSLLPRSESIVNVKCSKSFSLITADFEPKPIIGIGGVYATCCRIVPDLEGVFQVPLLNVNNDKVKLNSRKFIGTLSMVKDTAPKVKPKKVEKTLN